VTLLLKNSHYYQIRTLWKVESHAPLIDFVGQRQKASKQAQIDSGSTKGFTCCAGNQSSWPPKIEFWKESRNEDRQGGYLHDEGYPACSVKIWMFEVVRCVHRDKSSENRVRQLEKSIQSTHDKERTHTCFRDHSKFGALKRGLDETNS